MQTLKQLKTSAKYAINQCGRGRGRSRGRACSTLKLWAVSRLLATQGRRLGTKEKRGRQSGSIVAPQHARPIREKRGGQGTEQVSLVGYRHWKVGTREKRGRRGTGEGESVEYTVRHSVRVRLIAF